MHSEKAAHGNLKKNKLYSNFDPPKPPQIVQKSKKDAKKGFPKKARKTELWDPAQVNGNQAFWDPLGSSIYVSND